MRSHLPNFCGNFISNTSASAVHKTLSRLWICIAFVFSNKIDMAASSLEPVEIAESLSEDICTSSSIRPASSANARSDMSTVCGADPRVIPASCTEKILHSPAMKATGERMSPCRTPLLISNASEYSQLPSAFETRTQPWATL